MITSIAALSKDLNSYLEPQQVNQVVKAYHFANEAHEGQKRTSGEPYITHPLAVAKILAEMHMDHQCLMAALLHDVIEDTSVPKQLRSTNLWRLHRPEATASYCFRSSTWRG